MPIHFKCAQCQKAFHVADTAAGKQGRCSDCGHLNTIPDGSDPKPVVAAQVPATYEITSSANGAVFGPADAPTLKQWVKEGRVTAHCQIKKVGSEKWKPATALFPQLTQVAAEPRSQPVQNAGIVEAEATGDNGAFSKFQTPANGKMGDAGVTAAASTSANPYAAGATGEKRLQVADQIVPTSGDIGFIISRAFEVYTNNFGLVVGGFLVYIASVIGIAFVAGLAGAVGEIAGAIGSIVLMVASIFVFAGFVKLCLKVGRGEQAGIEDIFSAGDRVLPLLGYFVLLMGIFFVPLLLAAFVIGLLSQLIGPEAMGIGAVIFAITYLAVLLIAMLLWPSAILVLEGKTSILRAVPVGFSIATKNILQFIAVYIVAVLVTWAGLLAIGIGVIFTAPLGILIMMCAYLNMSGQIRE